MRQSRPNHIALGPRFRFVPLHAFAPRYGRSGWTICLITRTPGIALPACFFQEHHGILAALMPPFFDIPFVVVQDATLRCGQIIRCGSSSLMFRLSPSRLDGALTPFTSPIPNPLEFKQDPPEWDHLWSFGSFHPFGDNPSPFEVFWRQHHIGLGM